MRRRFSAISGARKRLPDMGSACFGSLIGIGGCLAGPSLPHHLAYGSVPRWFDRVKLGRAHRSWEDRANRNSGCAAPNAAGLRDRLEATLTTSPKTSPPLTITSPTLTPIRRSILSSSGTRRLLRPTRSWIAKAQSRAAIVEENSKSIASPAVLTTPAGALDDRRNRRLGLAMPANGADPVASGQATVANDIGGDDRRQLAVETRPRGSARTFSPLFRAPDRRAPRPLPRLGEPRRRNFKIGQAYHCPGGFRLDRSVPVLARSRSSMIRRAGRCAPRPLRPG